MQQGTSAGYTGQSYLLWAKPTSIVPMVVQRGSAHATSQLEAALLAARQKYLMALFILLAARVHALCRCGGRGPVQCGERCSLS